MHRQQVFGGALAATVLVLAALSAQPQGQGRAVVYEGGRVIVGDGSAPIDNGAIVVENGRISAVGKNGAVNVPSGAERVDLGGKTVMPTLVNTHIHIGYDKFTSWGAENYGPANIVDHLKREAYFGVGAVMSVGGDPTDSANAFAKQQQARPEPGAARFFFAPGMAPPNGGPDHILIKGTTALKAVYDVSNAAEARTAIATAAGKGVKYVKIWVDDRRGTYPKMTPDAYETLITEAHKRGMIVIAHATTMADSKAVLRAGADMQIHMPYADTLDAEYLALLKEKKPIVVPIVGLINTLRGSNKPICGGEPLVEEAFDAATLAHIRKENCEKKEGAVNFQTRIPENLKQMVQAGIRIVLGTDAGVFNNWTFGWTDHLELENYVKLGGLSNGEAIVAGTSRAAEFIGAKDLGTLAAGKSADFLVLNANPLDDIRNTRQIARVYLRGQLVDRQAIRAAWRATTLQ
jgi:imidazolonepropionase-like amidohydrolase